MLAFSFLAMESWYWIVIISAALLVPLIVVVSAKGKKKQAPGASAPPVVADAPPSVDAGMMAPAPSHPAQPTEERAPAEVAPEAKPEPKPEKPATLQVEALSPSMTDTMPALDAEADEMKMGTDELPKFGTSEMPQLDDGPAKYRTPAANELAEAITSGNCPKCKAPTFVGDASSDDNTMYTLNGRCGACGHKAQVIDMRVG